MKFSLILAVASGSCVFASVIGGLTDLDIQEECEKYKKALNKLSILVQAQGEQSDKDVHDNYMFLLRKQAIVEMIFAKTEGDADDLSNILQKQVQKRAAELMGKLASADNLITSIYYEFFSKPPTGVLLNF